MFSSNQGASNLLLERDPLDLDSTFNFDDLIQLDDDQLQQPPAVDPTLQQDQSLSQPQPPQQQQQPPMQQQQQLPPWLPTPNNNSLYVHEGLQRRRSSSVDAQLTLNNFPALSYSPSSSVEDNSTSPSMLPLEPMFSDLDFLIPPTDEQDARWWQQMQPMLQQQQQQQLPLPLKSNSRRRSSSVPPAFHSQYQKPIVFAQIKVADSRPPAPASRRRAPQQPSMPVQIERIQRHRIPSLTPEQQQIAMDQRLVHVNFNDVTVAELKQLLRHYGHSTSGRKADLIDRLKEERNKLLLSKSS